MKQIFKRSLSLRSRPIPLWVINHGILWVLVLAVTVATSAFAETPKARGAGSTINELNLSQLLQNLLRQLAADTADLPWLNNPASNSSEIHFERNEDLAEIQNLFGTESLSATDLPAKMKDPSLANPSAAEKVEKIKQLLAVGALHKTERLALESNTSKKPLLSLCQLNFSNLENFASFLGVSARFLQMALPPKIGLKAPHECGIDVAKNQVSYPIPRQIKIVFYNDSKFKFKSWSDINGLTLIFINPASLPDTTDLLLSYLHELAISLDALMPTSRIVEEGSADLMQWLKKRFPSADALISYEDEAFTEFLASIRAENYALAALGLEPIDICSLPARQLTAEMELYNQSKSRSSLANDLAQGKINLLEDIIDFQKNMARWARTGDVDSPELSLAEIISKFVVESKKTKNSLCRFFTTPNFLKSGRASGRFGPRGPKVGGGSAPAGGG